MAADNTLNVQHNFEPAVLSPIVFGLHISSSRRNRLLFSSAHLGMTARLSEKGVSIQWIWFRKNVA